VRRGLCGGSGRAARDTLAYGAVRSVAKSSAALNLVFTTTIVVSLRGATPTAESAACGWCGLKVEGSVSARQAVCRLPLEQSLPKILAGDGGHAMTRFEAKDYRRKAADCLRLAQQMRTIKAKQKLRDVAATWEQLASEAEKSSADQVQQPVQDRTEEKNALLMNRVGFV
jgi:hypothetical protein